MNDIVYSMLQRYKPQSLEDYENALREIMQELALLGLWRAKFFEHGLFYGGTALRILHGLRRFSEDIDLSLLLSNRNFDISSYLAAIVTELTSFGFEVSGEKKMKEMDPAIESAFLKANTLIHLLKFDVNLKVQHNKKMQIKLEVDTDPPEGFLTEVKYQLAPIPFSIRTMSLPSLFAGKLHAVLCRERILNVKGRDWYDFIWYVGRDIPVNLSHLRSRMIQTSHLEPSDRLSHEALLQMLQRKIEHIDFTRAIADVRPFLKEAADTEALMLWGPEFFRAGVLPKLRSVDGPL